MALPYACQDPNMRDQDLLRGSGHRPACAVLSPWSQVSPLGPSSGADTALGAQPGALGGAGTQSTAQPPELSRGWHRAGPLSLTAAGSSQGHQEVSAGFEGAGRPRHLSGEVTQRDTDRAARNKKLQVPLPFSFCEVQKGQQWRAPH